MSKASLQSILSRVVSEKEFRKEFKADPVKVMGNYSLTEDEKKSLYALDIDEFVKKTEELKAIAPESAIGSIYI